jgi:hypothetical protein
MPIGPLAAGTDLVAAPVTFDVATPLNRGWKAGTVYGAPSVTVGGALIAGTGATVGAVTGSDFGGRFAVTGGTGSTGGGTLATVSFGTPLGAVPSSVVVNASDNAGSNAISVGSNNLSTTGFAIVSGAAITLAHVYTVTYMTIQ